MQDHFQENYHIMLFINPTQKSVPPGRPERYNGKKRDAKLHTYSGIVH